MTDDQSTRLDEAIAKLQQTAETLSRASHARERSPATSPVGNPPDKLDQIIAMLRPMAENIEALRKELREMEPGKIAPEPPEEP